jgi:hypothetical protein
VPNTGIQYLAKHRHLHSSAEVSADHTVHMRERINRANIYQIINSGTGNIITGKKIIISTSLFVPCMLT